MPVRRSTVAIAGDEFLNNHVLLHTRREYEDWPEDERKRYVLRVCIYDDDSRPIPVEGRPGLGVQLKARAL